MRSTMDVPSRNRVRNNTFALVKRPSLSETTMNCEPLNLVRKSCPMCCVCERSRAASISSRMYIGAGLNWSKDMMRESAMSELWNRVNDENAWYSTSHKPLSATEFCETLLPYGTELHLDLKALREILAFWRLQLGKVSRQ